MNHTIKDVAEKAGVSPTSVSLVLNNRPNKLSEKTRQKIKEAAKALNYVPSSIARSLRSNSSRMIGLIIPDLTNPFFNEIAARIRGTLYQEDFTLLTIEMKHIEKDFRQFIAYRVDAVVMVGNSNEIQDQASFLAELKQLNIPVTIFDSHIEENPVYSSASVDHLSGGYLATQYLIEAGHQRIGLYMGPSYIVSAQERLAGFKLAMEENNLDPSIIYEGNYNLGPEVPALTYFMDQGCTAIFAMNDMMAVGLYKAARQLEVSIPEDLSIIGYDNIYLTEIVYPEMTTIHQPIKEMSAALGQIVIKSIADPSYKENIVFSPHIVERKSVKRMKKD